MSAEVPKLDPRHLRGILTREANAERAYEEARARAIREVINARDADHDPDDATEPLFTAAQATLTPSVQRAQRKLFEARVERQMAEHLLAGHLREEAV